MNRNGDLYKFETYRLVRDAQVIVNYFKDLDEVELHRHDFIEVAFVEAGHGWHVLNGIPMLARPGDLFVIDHGDVHYFMAEYDSKLFIYNLIFRPGFFDMALIGKQCLADVLQHPLLRAFRDDGFDHRGAPSCWQPAEARLPPARKQQRQPPPSLCPPR